MSDANRPGDTFGARLRTARERTGRSRAVLGGLVGKSEAWVKHVETGRLLQPRLPMLIRLANVLGVGDLSELTGSTALPLASYTKAVHENLPAVTSALTTYDVGASDVEPASLDDLTAKVVQAWQLWHGARHQRTAVAVVLPGLLRDAALAARLHEGADRRRAQAELARVYHLAQLYLSFQPASEMLMLTGDRAMTAAQDADDPAAIAAAAWYMNHIFRDAGERDEARIDLATRSAALLRPADDTEHLARWGLLQLAIALSHAKSGREGDALRHWDEASAAAQALGPGYAHPWLIFGPGMVDAYAVTINADIARAMTASRVADKLDLAAMPSATRRAFHLAEAGRAYYQRGEPIAAVHLYKQAWDQSPDTVKFSPHIRSAVLELSDDAPPAIRPDLRDLAERLDLPRVA